MIKGLISVPTCVLLALICLCDGFRALTWSTRPQTKIIVLGVVGGPGGLLSDNDVPTALAVLAAYDQSYLARMKRGREEGKTPASIEFERAQEVKSEGLQLERELLRIATKIVAAAAVEMTLGIKAESGQQGLRVLRNWVSGLCLKRGVLRAVDENNASVDVEHWMHDVSVYIKYNSSEGGDAYMKPYRGGYSGVIFQPMLADGEFRQYGDLPTAVHSTV